MSAIRFLHILKDDKFVEPVMKGFDKEENIHSDYVYYQFTDHKLSFIKEEDGIRIIRHKDEFIKVLKSDSYDVLYLHSFQYYFYLFLRYIPKEKIIIWWAWGYDIYGDQTLGLDSFINLDVYKPLTKNARKECMPISKRVIRPIARAIFSLPYTYFRKRLLKRVDFFQPVRHFDYTLMQEHVDLKALEYYRMSTIYCNSIPKERRCNGSILIGNSASSVNNHLDVWQAVSSCIHRNQNVIIPLNYGSKEYASYIKEHIKVPDNLQLFYLDTFMSRQDYFNMMDGCSYAVYGAMRQHAMGNISYALRHGIKVFLYKDSPIYKYLIDFGFKVFAIEDVNNYSFREPLSISDQQQNIDAVNREQTFRHRIGMVAFEEIVKRVNKQL